MTKNKYSSTFDNIIPIYSNGQISGVHNTLPGEVLNNDENLIEYIDLLYQIMGIDINFKTFRRMSKEERLIFIRDIKIKKVIEE